MAKEVNHAERSHALLSASGSHRWINCPASPRLEENFPEETSSYAEEGTLAHEFAELILKVDLKLMPMAYYRQQADKLRKHSSYYSGMEEDIKPYTDYVKQQFTAAKRVDKNAKLLIEQKFDLTRYVENGFGTSDCAIIYSGIVEVIDLKFGKGLQVEAAHNTQLKYYGLGVLETLPDKGESIKTVKLTIAQPRLDNISSWPIPAKFLSQWAEEVLKPKAIEAYTGEGEQVAGDWCQFCKARPKCRALHDLTLEAIRRDYDELLDPRLIDDQELIELYKKSDFITKFLVDVKGTVLKEALSGKKWQGYKLVEGRSNRQWVDESKAISKLEENLYMPTEYLNQKLKGLGDLEKLLGKAGFREHLEPLTHKPPGAPTLVNEDDKRPEWAENQAKRDFAEPIEEDFDDLI